MLDKTDNLVNPKNKEQPEYNLREAKESFKELKESLKKLDTYPRLKHQGAAFVVLHLDAKLILLKKNSIKTVYKELDDVKSAFFQILGLTDSASGIDAVEDTFPKIIATLLFMINKLSSTRILTSIQVQK